MEADRLTMIRAIVAIVRDYDPDPVKREVYEEIAHHVAVIARLLEGGKQMETMLSAYTELVTNTTMLLDPDAVKDGDPRAAVVVSLERDGGGDFYIDVKLSQLDGAQIAYVLGIAREYELEAREESGWLRLSRHLTGADLPEEDREPLAVEA